MSTTRNTVISSTHSMNKLNSAMEGNASIMPDLSGKNIVMGFWHNWPAQDSIGYQGGHFKEMALTDIPEQYNVIAVAFMKGSGIPTFTPYNMSDDEFRRQVGELNSQGRAVLMSLGGANAHIELTKGQEQLLANEIIRLAETYGFDGLDIDLEQAAITAADNRTVIPQALRMVKDHYRQEGKNFIISMAPEFPYLKPGGNYEPYITSLEGYYDFIAPQFYNQGGDGVYVDEHGWVAQDNDAKKEIFLFYLTDSLINGTRGFLKIPHDKFVIGLPSNIDAAATGYVKNPADALNALKRLKDGGQPIKGLMTWSVNWDAGTDKNGKYYNWEFIKNYGHISGGGGGISEKPTVPAGLTSTSQTETTVALQWNPSSGVNPVSHYTLYRNALPISKLLTTTQYTDKDLTANTEYQYQISATDSKGNTSAISSSITVKTKGGTSPVNQWVINKLYNVGDEVSYQEKNYRCLAKHTSRSEWAPTNAATLWQLVFRR
ncbi:carbohydrate-binding protein [Enterobacteriaceae bacterium LUAb1]